MTDADDPPTEVRETIGAYRAVPQIIGRRTGELHAERLHHPDDGDKEDRGRILVVAGSRELVGAAWLRERL